MNLRDNTTSTPARRSPLARATIAALVVSAFALAPQAFAAAPPAQDKGSSGRQIILQHHGKTKTQEQAPATDGSGGGKPSQPAGQSGKGSNDSKIILQHHRK